MSNKFVHKVSRLFQPMLAIPKNPTSTNITHKGYNLMVDNGIIKQVNPGMYALLPMGLSALQKLVNIVDNEMSKIGAQKLQLPLLTNSSLWKKTERLELMGQELFHLRDRHNKPYILSPTFEEMITKLISESDIKKANLPLLLYQISNKYRDELHPRLGLQRGREFVMKDLYSFDLTEEDAKNTYSLMCEAYDNIFKQIGINYVKAIGDSGVMGGNISHEYHYFSPVGEDKVYLCNTCNYAINKSISESECPQCKTSLTENEAVEVGHTFLLKTKYTETFNAILNKSHLVMGCYGLGLTRILATAIEVLSNSDYIRWPANLEPFTVCIIGPKKGSKEEHASNRVNEIYDILNQAKVDTIIDDRTEYTIGRRMRDANRTGYPFVIVVGKMATESRPLFELHDVYNNVRHDLTIEAVNDYFCKKYPDLDRKSMVY